eukprot:TRINITY_DN4419_c0_g1_i1.p1 TRINITY_DN4419_c0_g1~~TRINITY_DN4419_c0_g1_i1.p1  ORF type:complete len:195 (+),score=31.00 TRINITY_DN4419_c0_g1_i1:78-662(+)
MRLYAIARRWSSSTTGVPGRFLGRFPTKKIDENDPKVFLNGVPYLEESMTVEEASKLLTDLDVGAVPVLSSLEQQSKRRVTGMLSERDVCRAFGKYGSSLSTKTVGDLMTREVVFCSKEDSIENILSRMLELNFRHMPCQDEDNNLIGLVSMRDCVWSRHQSENSESKSKQEKPEFTIKAVDDFLSCITEATRI